MTFMIKPPQRHANSCSLEGRHKSTRLLRAVLGLVGLVEEEVSGELLVLVAREVGLDDKIALEAEAAKL